MARSLLILIAMFTLVVCNLHSPSMLHADDADHHAHTDQLGLGLADAVSDHVGEPATENDLDADRGIAPVGDHHAPAALAIGGSSLEHPIAARDMRRNGGNAMALLAWATAPPTEPPSA